MADAAERIRREAVLEQKLRRLERRRSYARRIDAIAGIRPTQRAVRLALVPLLLVAAGIWRGSVLFAAVGIVLLAAAYVVARGQRALAQERRDYGTAASPYGALDAEIEQVRRDLKALRLGPGRGSPGL